MLILQIFVRFNDKVQGFYLKIKPKMFWNPFIRYIFESALELQLAAGTVLFISLNTSLKANTQCETVWKSGLYISSTAILAAIGLMPLLFSFVMYRNRKSLSELRTRDRIGTLYEIVKPNGINSLSFSIVFLLRRSSFVALTFFFFEYPALQIQIQIFLNVFYIIYIYSAPQYDEVLIRRLDLFNESSFLIVCYHMMVFTNLTYFAWLKE